MDIQTAKQEAQTLSRSKSPALIKPPQPGQNTWWSSSSGNKTVPRKGGLQHELAGYVTVEPVDDPVKKVLFFPSLVRLSERQNTDFYDDQIESRPKSTHDTPK